MFTLFWGPEGMLFPCVDTRAHYRQKLESPWLLRSRYGDALEEWILQLNTHDSFVKNIYFTCLEKIKPSEQI